jgi:hypothetical protein
MLANDVFVRGEIDAEYLVARNEAFDPLDLAAKLTQRFIRSLCRVAKSYDIGGADIWNNA